MIRILACAILLLGGWVPCRAGSAGSDPFHFLFLDANARSVGMAGAYTALAKDSNALLYNPAGLGLVRRHEASFMHNQYFQGVIQEYMGFAARQGWGLSVNYLNSGSFPRTTVSNPDGTGLGSAALMDLALGAGYGKALGERFSVGAGLKAIRESIAGVTAQALALDAGILWSVPAAEGLRVGLAAQNLGPTVRFQSDKEKLPMNFRAGLGYVSKLLGKDAALSLDVSKERSDTAIAAAGVEWALLAALPLRAGYTTRNKAGPGVTAGLGWLYKDFRFDYAVVPFGDLGLGHRMSLTVRFGEGEPQQRNSRRQKTQPRRQPTYFEGGYPGRY